MGALFSCCGDPSSEASEPLMMKEEIRKHPSDLVVSLRQNPEDVPPFSSERNESGLLALPVTLQENGLNDADQDHSLVDSVLESVPRDEVPQLSKLTDLVPIEQEENDLIHQGNLSQVELTTEIPVLNNDTGQNHMEDSVVSSLENGTNDADQDHSLGNSVSESRPRDAIPELNEITDLVPIEQEENNPRNQDSLSQVELATEIPVLNNDTGQNHMADSEVSSLENGTNDANQDQSLENSASESRPRDETPELNEITDLVPIVQERENNPRNQGNLSQVELATEVLVANNDIGQNHTEDSEVSSLKREDDPGIEIIVANPEINKSDSPVSAIAHYDPLQSCSTRQEQNVEKIPDNLIYGSSDSTASTSGVDLEDSSNLTIRMHVNRSNTITQKGKENGFEIPTGATVHEARSSDPKMQHIDSEDIADLTGQITRSEINRDPIASGGFGYIYVANWQPTQFESIATIKVAIKVLRISNTEADSKLHERLQSELRVWHRLRHPHVLELLGTSSGFGPFEAMVSRWYKNGNISQYLRRSSLDKYSSQRWKLISQVAKGLQYLHSMNPPVVHGDLTSMNVLINDEKEACLCDFGLSKVIDEGDLSAVTNSVVDGNVRYMAPELLLEDANKTYSRVSTRTDIYSFGCVALEILTDELPFSGTKKIAQIYMEISSGGRLHSIVERMTPMNSGLRFIQLCITDAQSRPAIDEVVKQLNDLMRSLPEPAQSDHSEALNAATTQTPESMESDLVHMPSGFYDENSELTLRARRDSVTMRPANYLSNYPDSASSHLESSSDNVRESGNGL